MGTCGIIAGGFPVLRVDVPRYAPAMTRDGAGWETRASAWATEMHQDLQAWAGLSSGPAWPPQMLKVGRSENHCRTAMSKGLNLVALVTASIGPVAHLEAEWSVLPISYVTCQDNGLFAFLSISLWEDDKFTESNCEAFVQSGGVATWGELCQKKSWMKKEAGLQVLMECFNWHFKLKHICKGSLTERKFLWWI